MFGDEFFLTEVFSLKCAYEIHILYIFIYMFRGEIELDEGE